MDEPVAPLPDQNCYNRYCGKKLTAEDATTCCGMFKVPFYFTYHLCNDCWAKFDGQKMRGRFRMIGIGHESLVALTAKMDQEVPGGCPFTVGHPSEEERYTESMDEWIGWQAPKPE